MFRQMVDLTHRRLLTNDRMQMIYIGLQYMKNTIVGYYADIFGKLMTTWHWHKTTLLNLMQWTTTVSVFPVYDIYIIHSLTSTRL